MDYTALDLHTHISSGMSVHGRSFTNFGIEDQHTAFVNGDFEGAVFVGVCFERCDFTDASFKHAFFSECSFIDCELEGTNFESIQTDGLSICDCRCEGISFDLAELDGLSMWACHGRMSFQAADLEQSSSIIQCGINQSDFRNANIKGTLFMESDLSESEFDAGTNLEYPTFNKCDMTDTWAYMARGGETAVFDESFSEPFSRRRLQVTEFPLAERLPTQVRMDLSPYNVSSIAHLYCADIEEFKATK